MSIQMRISNIRIFFEIFCNVTVPYVHNVICKRDLAVSQLGTKKRKTCRFSQILTIR